MSEILNDGSIYRGNAFHPARVLFASVRVGGLDDT
jgi:hypothetical protein